MDTESQKVEARLEKLWEGARQGDGNALDDLLRFIVKDGRRHLRKYIPRADNPHAGRPTEVLQRTAVKIHEKVTAGTLEKPKETALKTLGRYLVLTAKEVLHFIKITGGDLAPASRIGFRERHEVAEDPSAETPFRKVADDEDDRHKKERLRQEVERLPEPYRSILRESLAGKNDLTIAQEMGLSSENVRQRRHRATLRLTAILKQEFAA